MTIKCLDSARHHIPKKFKFLKDSIKIMDLIILGWSLLCFVPQRKSLCEHAGDFSYRDSSRASPEKKPLTECIQEAWCVEMQSASPWIFTDYSHGVFKSKICFETYCQESSGMAVVHSMGVSIFIPVSVFAHFDCVLVRRGHLCPIANEWQQKKERERERERERECVKDFIG